MTSLNRAISFGGRAWLLGWLRAYAAASGTTAAYNSILDAATPGDSDKPAKTTTIGYRDVLARLWLLDPLPGWAPTGNPFYEACSNAQTSSRRSRARSEAAELDRRESAARAGSGAPTFGRAEPIVGGLFESLVALDVRVYAQAAQAAVSHLRTRDGDHEIDLIVEGAAGRVLALEVKLASNVSDKDVRHLRWLRTRIGEDLLDAAVITTGPYAYRRSDGIAVIPAALLGP